MNRDIHAKFSILLWCKLKEVTTFRIRLREMLSDFVHTLDLIKSGILVKNATFATIKLFLLVTL